MLTQPGRGIVRWRKGSTLGYTCSPPLVFITTHNRCHRTNHTAHPSISTPRLNHANVSVLQTSCSEIWTA